jgi:hypothetical protein
VIAAHGPDAHPYLRGRSPSMARSSIDGVAVAPDVLTFGATMDIRL